jgi:hypothetical protein
MALDNLSGQRIQESFQKLVQVESGVFADGTGSAIAIVTGDQTASFAHKTAISGAFYAPSASISTRLATLEATEEHLHNGALSSSAQIATEISGAFVAPSASFSTRVTNLKTDSGSFSTRVTNLKTNSGSFSTRVTDLKTDSGSFSTRVTNLKTDSGSFSTRVTGLKTDSGSFEDRVTALKTDSGSFSTRVTNLKTDSSSFSTRVSSNETDISSLTAATSSYLLNTTNTLTGDLTVTGKITAEEFHTEFVTSSVIFASGSSRIGNSSDDIHQFTGSILLSGSSIQLNGKDLLPFTATSISESLGVNANLIRSLTSASISGSFTEASHSLQSRLTTASHSLQSRLTTAELELSNTLISGSAQIKSEISGAFTAASHSLQSRITTNETDISSLTAKTSSYLLNTTDTLIGDLTVTGRLTAEEYIISSSVTNLVTQQLSGSTKFGNTSDDSHQFTGSIFLSGSSIQLNGKELLPFTSTSISGSFVAPSSSFSTRVTNLESTSSNRIFNHVTASGGISASGNISMMSASIGGGIFTSASLALAIAGGGGTGVGFPYSGSDSLTNSPAQAVITGSLLLSGSGHITASGNISASNINVGKPTSNNWGENLQGSYFNNFNANTDVSEILRFIAGALSHSLNVADAAPNTKTYGSVTTNHTQGSTTSKSALLNGVLGSACENARLSQHWTASAFIDFSETASYRAVQNYLELKGWLQASDRGTFGNDTGTNPFHGSYASRIPSPILTNATFDTNNFTVSANTSGTTNVSSAGTTFGLGQLSNGAAVAYNVKVIASHSFSDNYADTTPDKNSTFHTASFKDFEQSSFGTSGDGLTLTKIVTSQPAVIPSAYQDGDFNNVAGTISGRYYTGGSQNENSISASGYYLTHDIKVGLKYGGQSDFTFKNGGNSDTKFYLYTSGLPSDITDNANPTVVVTQALNIASFSATSRSLSGAPYILTCDYTIDFDSQVSKSFDPGYGRTTTVLYNYRSTDEWNNVGSVSLTNTSVYIDTGGINHTPGDHIYVIDKTKTTKRANNTIPHISDIAVASSSFEFELDSNIENVSQNRSSNQSLNYDLVFKAKGTNWKGTNVYSTTSTTELYNAGRFGQNADSGSMAIYSRAQGYDSNTLQDSSETFTGEDNRIVLADNVQAFNGTLFTTGTYKTNDNSDVVIGQYDLQVKPGYLVNPIGSYGYWFTTDSLTASSTDYRFYIRKFQVSSARSQVDIHLSNKSLVNWTSTANNSIACAILFESSGNGSGNNVALSRARIYDPTKDFSAIEENISQDNHKNPFTTAIDLYGCPGAIVKTNNIYNFSIDNTVGQYLDTSDNQFYVIVRYKGDPAPIQEINVSTS